MTKFEFANSESVGMKIMMEPTLGHLRGRVTDLDGNGLINCKVWIRETEKSTYSDDNGDFVLINIQPAIYTIIAEKEGYVLSVLVDIPIEQGDNPGNSFALYSAFNKFRIGRRRGALAIPMH